MLFSEIIFRIISIYWRGVSQNVSQQHTLRLKSPLTPRICHPSQQVDRGGGCNEMRRCDGCILASWCIYDESFLCKWLINQHHPTPKWKWLWVKPLQCLNVKNKLTLSWCRWLVIEDQQLDACTHSSHSSQFCVCAVEVRAGKPF